MSYTPRPSGNGPVSSIVFNNGVSIVPTTTLGNPAIAVELPGNVPGFLVAGSAIVTNGISNLDTNQVVGLRQPQILYPDGGSVIDSQARETIAVIMGVLGNHGLTEQPPV